MIDLILIGGVVVLLNMLDSVTTELGFRLPAHLRSKESNPFMKSFLENHPVYAHTFKQIAIIGIVAFVVLFGDMRIMVMLAVMFGLVVVNNTYIWLGRKITNRKIRTPLYNACKACHIPENCYYFVWVAITVPTAWAIGFLLF